MEKIKVAIEISKDEILPIYATPTDAGMDIHAYESIYIKPQETKIIPTGIRVAIPEGYEIQVRPRSGLSYNTPLRIANSVGTIDAGFRGEIGIIMTNTSEFKENNDLYILKEKGNKKGTYLIRKGDRIAQLVLQKVPRIEWEVVKDVSKIGTNRDGGFGSTGIQ